MKQLTLHLLLSLPALAQVPTELPRPDGQPGDNTKPVQVYILAGQSNMVGMGDVGGAKNRYAGVFLSADPAAPVGPFGIHQVGEYRVARLWLFASARSKSSASAMASTTSGEGPAATDAVAHIVYGVASAQLPPRARNGALKVSAFLEVPETGHYTVHPGHGASSHNVAWIDGEEVYRRGPGEPAVITPVRLEAGRSYKLMVDYAESGSAAFWLSRADLVGSGDLEGVVKREGKFGYLVDDDGNWTVRQDVRYQEARIAPEGAGSMLTATSNGKSIGPELGFGHVVGTYHDAPVLLIKTAMGNRALGFDFRPPSSGRNEPDSEWEALEWRLMVEGVHKTLARIDELVPGYQGQGYELAGFAWWQGHKDGFTPALIDEYQQNLVHLIDDVRAEFDAPDMLAVVATVGFGGHGMAENYLRILEAQLAVADGESIASVDTRGFWRDVEESPTSQGHHYNRNAETYLLVGEALGRAMVRLEGGEAGPLPIPPREPRPIEAAAAADHGAPAAKVALAPMLLDGVASAYVSARRENLQREARGERAERPSQFLRGQLYGLENIYRAAGSDDYEWKPFGADLREQEWQYHSFEPAEEKPKDKGDRYREVAWPTGMQGWQSPDFDASAWPRGLPPFGQLDGELAPLSANCTAPFCGCGTAPRTKWEHEVLMLRGTFEVPPLDPGKRYRIVVGGSSHVAAGDGYALYVDGQLVHESNAGVHRRQGGQPRGGHITSDLREVFADGEVTIAIHSFLRYNTPRGPIPQRGHLSVWIEEAATPPLR